MNDMDLTYLFDNFDDKSNVVKEGKAERSSKSKRGLGIRVENEANIPKINSASQIKPSSDQHKPAKFQIYSDSKSKVNISKDKLFKLVIDAQNREIIQLKKRYAFSLMKNNTMPKVEPTHHHKGVGKNPSKTSNLKGAADSDIFSPKKRRFESGDMSQREQYLSDVCRSNIFDTPPRAKSRDLPATTSPAKSNKPFDIFSSGQKAPLSASRPPKPRSSVTTVEELCENIPNPPTSPVMNSSQTQHQKAKPTSSEDTFANLRRQSHSPASRSKFVFGSPTKASFQKHVLERQTSENTVSDNLANLLQRLSDLESEVSNIHISESSERDNKRSHVNIDNKATSPQTAQPGVHQQKVNIHASTTSHNTDGHETPFTTPPRKAKSKSGDMENVLPSSVKDTSKQNTAADGIPSKKCDSSPSSMRQETDVTLDDSDPTISTQSKNTEEEFKHFCIQLSKASCPDEVRDILQPSNKGVNVEDRDVDIKVFRDVASNNKPKSTSGKPTPSSINMTPVSVSTLLSPLGSQGSGTSSKVAITDLSSYQSKLSTWRKKYPSSNKK